jgi:hypothetical protein
MKKNLIAIYVAVLLPAGNAYAFGLGDIVNIGIQAGTKVIGAAVGAGIDKVKEAMRDPEAEAREKAEKERQIAEAFKKQVDEIEAKPGLRPIDRERLILILSRQQEWAKQMQSFAEQAEARQKAERDKIFTASGFLGVVGEAALNSPSMVIARADAMTKNPIWRAEQRMRTDAVFAQADAQMATGMPQAKSRAALAQADLIQKSGINEAGTKAVTNAADAMTGTGVTKQEIETVAEAAAGAKEAAPQSVTTPADAGQARIDAAEAGSAAVSASSKDAFVPDLGRRLYVEFVGSPTETAHMRNRLQSMGHTMAASREEAEVVYLVEGEYTIPETKHYEGVTMNLAELLNAPDKPIPAPKKKLSGTLAAGVSKFMLAMAAAQGQNIPAGAVPKEGVYQQEALLVIARQPKGGKETRFSVVKSVESADLAGAKLALGTRDDLYAALGLTEPGAGLPENAKN